MSNPIGYRYSLCQQNKFTIQMRSYHVITFYKTVLPGTSISSYTRFSTLRTHGGDYQHRVILTKPSPILFCLILRMRFIGKLNKILEFVLPEIVGGIFYMWGIYG